MANQYNDPFPGGTVFSGTPQQNDGRQPYSYSVASASIATSYPLRKDYQSAEAYALAMVLYLANVSQQVMPIRFQAYREAISLYADPTTFDKIAADSRVPDLKNTWAQESPSQNVLAPLVDISTGEFVGKEFEVRVAAINPEAYSRKAEFERLLRLDKYLKSVEPELRQMAETQLPNSDMLLEGFGGDVERYMQEGYVDSFAGLMTKILKEWMETPNPMTFKVWAAQTYKLYEITDAANALPQVDPQTLRVLNPFIHPGVFVPDVNCADNHFSSSQYCMWFEYVSLQQLSIRYPNLDFRDLLAFQTSGDTYLGLPTFRNRDQNRMTFEVLVVHCYWVSPEDYEEEIEVEVGVEVVGVDSPDMGVPTFEERPVMEKQTIKGRADRMYYSVTVAGLKVLQFGQAPYQIRSASEGFRATMPNISLAYDYELGATKPNRFISMAYLQDSFIYNFNKLLDLAGRLRGTIIKVYYDKIGMLPGAADEAESLKQFLQTLSSDGIALTNSRYDDMPEDGRDPVSLINADGNGTQIAQLRAVCDFILQQIWYQLSYSPARLGQGQQYATAQNVISQAQQSNFGTGERNYHFQVFLQRTLTHVTSLLKMSLKAMMARANDKDPAAIRQLEMFRMKYGDAAIEMIPDLPLQDMGVTVRQGPDQKAQAQLAQQIALTQLQQGAPAEAVLLSLSVIKSDNIDEIIANVQKLADMQAQQAQAQAQAQDALLQQAAAEAEAINRAPQPPAQPGA